MNSRKCEVVCESQEQQNDNQNTNHALNACRLNNKTVIWVSVLQTTVTYKCRKNRLTNYTRNTRSETVMQENKQQGKYLVNQLRLCSVGVYLARDVPRVSTQVQCWKHQAWQEARIIPFCIARYDTDRAIMWHLSSQQWRLNSYVWTNASSEKTRNSLWYYNNDEIVITIVFTNVNTIVNTIVNAFVNIFCGAYCVHFVVILVITHILNVLSITAAPCWRWDVR